jgi:ABC-type lipoprotein release transport system permease subunit
VRVLFYLAFRTLVRSRISFVLLLAAVTAGLGLQIPNVANLDGYTEELHEKGIAQGSGHIIVSSHDSGAFADANTLATRIAKEPFVKSSAVRFVHVGFLSTGDKTASAIVAGIHESAENATIGFCGNVAEGKCITSTEKHHAVISAQLATQIGAKIGLKLKVAFTHFVRGELKVASEQFEIVGILGGNGGLRPDFELYVPIAAMQDLFKQAGHATEIRVFTTDDLRADEWAKQVAVIAPDNKVESWTQVNGFAKNAIESNKAITAISTTMVIIAVMIPVLALLYIHVLSERRRIATIAALGFSRREIFVMHLFEALIVGGLGTLLGTGVGYALCRYFMKHPIFSNAGFVVLPAMTANAFVVPALVLFATTLVAGILPAVIASRAEPAVELRRE